MKELLKALKALERLGAVWKARRITRGSNFNTIQCTTFVQTDEGVIKGLIEAQGTGSEDRRTKAEVTCYLGGRLEKDGMFEIGKHSRTETVKLFEYQNTVMLKHSSGFLGIGRGFRPAGMVPAEHQFLVDFAERLIVEIDRQNQAAASARAAEDDARKSANEAKAKHALFGRPVESPTCRKACR